MPLDLKPGAMRAHASLATEATPGIDGRSHTHISELRSEVPISLRITNPKEPHAWADCLAGAARVSVAAAAAGPVGGDRFTFDIDVGPDSALVLADVSATLLLPGPYGDCSHTTTQVRVGDGATLVWLPEPIIAAAHCNHVNDLRIDLAPTARLLLREELILGRHGEQPGTIEQRLKIRRGGRPLFHQDLHIGPDATGWNSAAVAATCRAVGSTIVVDPQRDWSAAMSATLAGTAALLTLPGPAAMITALGDDNLQLRTALNAGLSRLGKPWQASTESSSVPTEMEARPCQNNTHPAPFASGWPDRSEPERAH
ncbi:urease accessory protein UreD [Mycobacterium sp. E802]|uniref:urease accessory protein UreD n=1 Tax=Mycobacterium sp. E802 TaxID=1834152 RepID=UPI000A944844|nr:urease accessory protein UreD [Mycobacterium sp. E802]